MELFTLNHLNFAYPEQEKQAVSSDPRCLSMPGNFWHSAARLAAENRRFCGSQPVLFPARAQERRDSLFEGRPLTRYRSANRCREIGLCPAESGKPDRNRQGLARTCLDWSLGYDTPTPSRKVAEMASSLGDQALVSPLCYGTVRRAEAGFESCIRDGSAAKGFDSRRTDKPASLLQLPIFLATLSRPNRELGTTVILTEHRLEEAFSRLARGRDG